MSMFPNVIHGGAQYSFGFPYGMLKDCHLLEKDKRVDWRFILFLKFSPLVLVRKQISIYILILNLPGFVG